MATGANSLIPTRPQKEIRRAKEKEKMRGGCKTHLLLLLKAKERILLL